MLVHVSVYLCICSTDQVTVAVFGNANLTWIQTTLDSLMFRVSILPNVHVFGQWV